MQRLELEWFSRILLAILTVCLFFQSCPNPTTTNTTTTTTNTTNTTTTTTTTTTTLPWPPPPPTTTVIATTINNDYLALLLRLHPPRYNQLQAKLFLCFLPYAID